MVQPGLDDPVSLNPFRTTKWQTLSARGRLGPSVSGHQSASMFSDLPDAHDPFALLDTVLCSAKRGSRFYLRKFSAPCASCEIRIDTSVDSWMLPEPLFQIAPVSCDRTIIHGTNAEISPDFRMVLLLWSGRSPAPVTTAGINQRSAQLSHLRRVNRRQNYISNCGSRRVRGVR